MNKGDIWIIEAPSVDGHEQEGVRPAIVIANTESSVAVIIPCTSNLKALRLPHTFSINPSRENGLKMMSVALVLQIRAIDKKRLKKRIGVLEKKVMQDIDNMLKKMLQL